MLDDSDWGTASSESIPITIIGLFIHLRECWWVKDTYDEARLSQRIRSASDRRDEIGHAMCRGIRGGSRFQVVSWLRQT